MLNELPFPPDSDWFMSSLNVNGVRTYCFEIWQDERQIMSAREDNADSLRNSIEKWIIWHKLTSNLYEE